MTRRRERREEGAGGAPSAPSTSSMTKSELLTEAARLGVVVDSTATKADVQAAIEAAKG